MKVWFWLMIPSVLWGSNVVRVLFVYMPCFVRSSSYSLCVCNTTHVYSFLENLNPLKIAIMLVPFVLADDMPYTASNGFERLTRPGRIGMLAACIVTLRYVRLVGCLPIVIIIAYLLMLLDIPAFFMFLQYRLRLLISVVCCLIFDRFDVFMRNKHIYMYSSKDK